MTSSLTAHAPVANEIDAAGQARQVRLVDFYESFFDTVFVDTEEDLEASFRLRYDIYCVENQFLDPAKSPHGLEIDEYDARSVHSLLLRRGTDEVVGTVRLILPNRSGEGIGMPIGDVCAHDFVVRDHQVMPWGGTAEISRFGISKKLRRRDTDLHVAGSTLPPECDSRRRIPDTSLGLMQAVIGMAAKAGITHLCAVMDPMLLRMLRRLGMVIPSLGPEVQYHGSRQPCYSHLDTALARIWLRRTDVWELLTRDGTLWPLNTDLVSWLRKREPILSDLSIGIA